MNRQFKLKSPINWQADGDNYKGTIPADPTGGIVIDATNAKYWEATHPSKPQEPKGTIISYGPSQTNPGEYELVFKVAWTDILNTNTMYLTEKAVPTPFKPDERVNGRGATIWMIKDPNDIAKAIAAPQDETYWDKVSDIADFPEIKVSKEKTEETYIDNVAGWTDGSFGMKKLEDVTLSLAFKPGDKVQHRMYKCFCADSSEPEKTWWRTHIPANGAVNMLFGGISAWGEGKPEPSGDMKREVGFGFFGTPHLSEEFIQPTP